MIVLIVFCVILIAGIIGLIFIDSWDHQGWHTVCIFVTVIAVFVILILAVSIPIERYEIKRDIDKVEAFRETVQNSRNRNMSDIERFAMLKEVAAWNERLAGTKFDNKNGWDLWVPDEVENVQPIK